MVDPTSKGRHILAIDNSEEVLEVFRLLLEEEGYRVSTQPYMFKDLDAIHELRPDLIILDYMWPEEDGGWSMLQMLRMERATAKTPIVLCTGAKKQVEELGEHFVQMDVSVVLKPFDIDTLLAVISKRLDAKGADGMTNGVTDKAAQKATGA